MNLGATVRPDSPSPIAPIGGFNWNLADAVELSNFHLSKHSRRTSDFLHAFSHASTFSGGTREQMEKTLRLSQRAVKALAKRVERLAQENRRLQSEAAGSGRGPIIQERFLCPVCLETLKSLVDLDSHILVKHPEKASRWNELRAPPVIANEEADAETREMISDMIGVVNRRFEEMKALIESKTHRREHKRRRTNGR